MTNEVSLDNVQLLLVEDDKGFAEQLVKSLGKRGYQQITVAKDAAETKTLLEAKAYDLIIADMRLGTDAAGGFGILEMVKNLGITSVLIVLTANDTVLDCRRAFKAGAWDYISKNRDNPVAKLHTSMQEALRYYSTRGRRADEEWLEAEMPTLLAKYGGQYLAVLNQKVITAAATKEELALRLVEQHLPYYMPVVKLIGNPPSIEELIQRGESATLEFKSTLRWSVKDQKEVKELHFAVLKTIVAFLNSEGGTLLIGVKDDGTIFGLERDYPFTRSRGQEGRDGFEQTLVSLITDHIGGNFMRLLKINFETVAEKDVCMINVQKSEALAFLRDKEFYIRSGNSSRTLEGTEMISYIKFHWG